MKADVSRRKFLKISALAAGATMLPLRWIGSCPAAAFAQSLPLLKKDAAPFRGLAFSDDVLGVIPPEAFYANDPNGIPVLAGRPDPYFANTLLYKVTAGEFTDQLHPKMGPTTLWGYYDTEGQNKKHLAGVIIASRGTASRVRVTNALPPAHILPVDTTLMNPNLTNNRMSVHQHGGLVPWVSDGGPFSWFAPAGTSGPGARGPTSTTEGLSFMNGQGGFLDALTGNTMTMGQADYYYPNDLSSRLTWYHDHAWGITRLNAYAGLATGYLCLDLNQEAPFASGAVLDLINGTTGSPNGQKFGQLPQLTALVPLIIQDKIFVNNTTAVTDPTWNTVAPSKSRTDGSLWYAHVYDRKLYRVFKGTGALPPPDPSCVPEFFGDTMLVNGTVAPVVPVQARRFRFQLLNACNARFLNLNLLRVNPGCEVSTNRKTGLPAGQFDTVNNVAVAALPTPGPQMIQIATEGGYLQKPVVFPAVAPTAATGNIVPFNPATFRGNLIVGNAERAEIIIDFSGFPVGTEFVFYNDAPGPFPAGAPTNDYFAGNPATPAAMAGSTVDTRNVIRLRVVAGGTADPQPPANTIQLPPMDPAPLATGVGGATPLTVPATAFVRNLTLNEDFDLYGRLRQLLGTTTQGLVNKAFGLDYLAPATEVIAQGTTEVWRIFNNTADTHPIHFHLQTCQVVSRQPFKLLGGTFTPAGVARGPEPNEMGWKDTVRMNPGEVTTVIFKWDQGAVPFTVPFSDRPMGAGNSVIPQANEFVWHCHILEHEEHDMMRPLVITGQNPQRPNILPTGGTIEAALQTFTVTTALSAVTLIPHAFSVTPGPGAPAATVTLGTATQPGSFVADFTGLVGSFSYTVRDTVTGLTASVSVTVQGPNGG